MSKNTINVLKKTKIKLNNIENLEISLMLRLKNIIKVFEVNILLLENEHDKNIEKEINTWFNTNRELFEKFIFLSKIN